MAEEVKWTKEQEQSIYEKGNNILVAAAAGSGKTAVLVERIINKIINEKIDIDRLLVVTFTNAAASEMRERVLKAIYKKIDEKPDDERLQRQVTLLNKSSICTIDSFCFDVVRNNFFEIDLSNNFRIGDTTEIEILQQDVLEDLFEEKYENNDEDFLKLVNTYTEYRDDTPLKDLILTIYKYIQSNPYPEKWLHEKIEMFNFPEDINQDFSKTTWGNILLNQIKEIVDDGIYQLKPEVENLSKIDELKKSYELLRGNLQQLELLQANLDTWDKAYEIYSSINFGKWLVDSKIKTEDKISAQKVRSKVIKSLEAVADKVLVMNSQESFKDIIHMYKILNKLENVILEFSSQFSKKKKEKNIVDFSDIEHFALKILIDENGNPTEIAKKYQQKFEEIAIDEYQDSNLVQEYILTSISKGNNIFMVGDVKQSIYKFRQARPDLFLDKYKKYKLKQQKTEKDDLKIQLFKNFRSRREVLDFSNLIFSKIMSEELGELNYTEEEYLNLGADYKDTGEDLKAEIDIIQIETNDEKTLNPEELEVESLQEDVDDEEFKEEVERKEDIEVEAQFVANKIKQLIENKFQVYDAKNKIQRDIKYKDIVILLRSTKTSAPIFEKEIIKLGMPVFSDSSSEYLESLEIQTIMNLLKIIDNPLQEIPLVATMRSMIGGFTDNDLVKIRLCDKYDNFYTTILKSKINVDEELRLKIEDFLNKLEMWRKEQEYLSLPEFIWKIYNDTGYFNYVGLMKNGELRQANLKMLFEIAKQCENISFKGLYNFINYIEKIKTSSKDMDSARVIGENDDVIRIMSIHKSKGLEFPIVILANTEKQFNLQDLNQKILLHPELGIGVKYIDYDLQIRYDTLSKRAIRNKIKIETLSEEMRVLYVALTRAKEKIIITGFTKKEKIDKMMENVEKYENLSVMLLQNAKSYLEWLMLIYNYNKEKMNELSTWNYYKKDEIINIYEKENKKEDEEDISKNIIKKLDEYPKEEKLEKQIIEKLNYIYPFIESTIIPTKTSVTQIKQMSLESKINNINRQYSDIIENDIDKLNNYKCAYNNAIENNIRINQNPKTLENIDECEELPKPKFLQSDEDVKITNAEKGTLIHLCMQKLDVKKQEYNLEGIKELVEKLVAKKIITQQEAYAINLNKILQFTKSNIWKEMTKANVVEREKPFYINIPAKEIYNKNVEEKILVQGIIDLYYINEKGKLILVDFKTDYVANKQEKILIDKYKTQLELYKNALESALERKVDKAYIYSTYLEKEIEVNLA